MRVHRGWTLDEITAVWSVRGHHRKGLHTRAGQEGEPGTMVTSLVIVEMQSKTTSEGCSVQKCLNLVLLRASEEADHQKEHWTHFQREINRSSCLGNQVDIAL